MVEAEYLIDTNIFLEVLLEQQEKESCLNLLEKIETGEIRAVITSFSLHTIAIILEKLKGIESYKQFLEVIINFNGLMIYFTTPEDEIEICKISQHFALSFDDAMHYYIAKKFNLKLVSLDADFDKTDIHRVIPSSF